MVMSIIPHQLLNTLMREFIHISQLLHRTTFLALVPLRICVVQDAAHLANLQLYLVLEVLVGKMVVSYLYCHSVLLH